MKKKLLFVIFCLSVTITICAGQTLNPYLQALTPNSIWVSWKTASGTETTVLWGTSASSLTNTVTGTQQTLTDAGYSGGYIYHTAKLSGLNPNTKYYYQIKTGSTTSEISDFRTPPAAGATNNGHIRHVIVGDNQLISDPRYDSIMVRIKRKLIQKYGQNYNDSVSFVLQLGDQVDNGTLDQYENVHFNKTKYLSNKLAFMTAVGNHETYGSQNLALYANHFVLDDNMTYKGISSGTEYYYAFQIGNVLYIQTSTEHTTGTVGTAQTTWVSNVLNAAATDNTVNFIVLVGHRPYTCEQYVGDISSWIRNTVVPLMAATNKCVLEIGAHHHLYARGQLKNAPMYQIISGATAWDQYWGMSTELDDPETQKTLSQWPYQIVDFDLNKMTMTVETYSVGSVFGWKESQLIDQFHRTLGKAAPNTPSITNTFSGSITLPVTINSSAFSTSTNELYNTTQFQFSLSSTFASVEKEVYRDYENWYGMAGGRKDSTLNQNAGVDIFKADLAANSLVNGIHYVRVRHRDRNLEWSGWSTPVSFTVTGSTLASDPTISVAKMLYNSNENIVVSYANGPGSSSNKDWIGIYKKGDTPGGPASTDWNYVTGKSGTTTLNVTATGEYFIAYFINDGYTEVATRITQIYVGPTPDVVADRETYNTGDVVTVSYSNGPNNAADQITIYKIGMDPAVDAPLYQSGVTGASGNHAFTINTKGYYFAVYKYKGSILVSNRFSFSVGNLIATISTDKSIYNVAENITVTFADGPGIAKDWLGIYPATSNPQVDPLLSYTYVGGRPAGTQDITGNNLPAVVGEYYVVFFTNDSYTEISERANFSVVDPTLGVADGDQSYGHTDHAMAMYPNPTDNIATVQSKYPITQLELMNAEGESLYKVENLNSLEFRIDKGNLPAGIYFVRIQSEKIYNLKLVVK